MEMHIRLKHDIYILRKPEEVKEHHSSFKSLSCLCLEHVHQSHRVVLVSTQSRIRLSSMLKIQQTGITPVSLLNVET